MDLSELISEMETIVFSGTKLDISYCVDDYLDAIIDKTINVFAYNNGSENLIAENITNSVNQSEFNFYRYFTAN